MVKDFLSRYVRRYAWTYAFGVAFLIATNVLTVAIPRMQKEVFDELAGGRSAAVVDHYALLIALAAVLVIVVRTLSRILFFNPGRTIEFRIRNDMLARLLHMSPQFFRKWSIGDIMARAGDDATFVRALVGFSVVMALNIVVAAVLAVWQMARTDAWLTLYCVLPMIAAVLALRTGVKHTFVMMKEGQEALGTLSETVLETYKGIAVVQGAAAEGAFLHRFDTDNARYTRLGVRAALVRTFLLPIVGVVGNLCIFLLLFVGGQHVIEGRMTLGDMAAYASYVAVLVGALASGGWVVGVLQRGMVSLRRVWDVISLEPDLPQGTVPLPHTGTGVHLTVRDLTWRYPDAADASPPALQGLSLDLPPGKVLGVYGQVGSGKSTLVQVLGRLALPPRGTVFVDGIDLLDVAGPDLRKAVAIVPQDAFLFSRSVRDNVAFVDRSHEADPARVELALARACMAGEVQRLQDGLETIVGERGLTLSGGQRQRVQLARAFYRGYRLLVLDDVLSAVDQETEAQLLATLAEEIRQTGTTAVVISHRLSALAAADEIVVLEEGRVVEHGRHADLVKQGGLYARVWEAQIERRDPPQDQPTARILSAPASAAP